MKFYILYSLVSLIKLMNYFRLILELLIDNYGIMDMF